MYNALSKAVNDLEIERRDVMMDDFMLYVPQKLKISARLVSYSNVYAAIV